MLIIDKQRPRNSWPTGRVIETYRGADDLVRSARVRLRGLRARAPHHQAVRPGGGPRKPPG